MLEKNSLDVAAVIEQWTAKAVPTQAAAR
jgi:hypothetical protein